MRNDACVALSLVGLIGGLTLAPSAQAFCKCMPTPSDAMGVLSSLASPCW